MKRQEKLDAILKELAKISIGIGKDLMSIVVPSKSEKPNWCNCDKCGQWHFQAK